MQDYSVFWKKKIWNYRRRALQTINHRRSALLEKVHFILQTAVKDSKKKEKVPLAALLTIWELNQNVT